MQCEEALCSNLEILFVDTLILYQAVLRKSILGKAYRSIVWLARPSHLTARGAKGKGRSSGSND